MKLYTIQHFSQILKIRQPAILDLRRRGDLESCWVGRKWLTTDAHIDTPMRTRKVRKA